MRPTIGLTFGGRYQLVRRIAIGGMGEVWDASDLVIGRHVALKILKDEYTNDPTFLERFRAEARHAALVNHEGIANVYDYGEEEGSAYLVMELVPGEALSTILEREKSLSTERVLDIVAQTASALQAAHSVGLVHRDVKPGNLLITPDNQVKITDFGIARIADQVPLTATGQVMGTVQYLSPEQASGKSATPATDIYSLGIVAYESLAGNRPFTGESQVAIAMAQINDQPPKLPNSIPEQVRNLVYSCLAKDPNDRPASAAHLSRAAKALRRGDIVAAVASVPQVLGDKELHSIETLEASIGANTTKTLRQLGEPPTETRPTIVQSRSVWTWPLIALIGFLAIVLIVTLVALLFPPNPSPNPPTPTTSTTTTTTTTTTTPPPTPTTTTTSPETFTIVEEVYIGKEYELVRDTLTAEGFEVRKGNGNYAPSPDKVNTVQSIEPSGTLPLGTVVFVTVYQKPPVPMAPADPPTLNSDPDDVVPGAVITISWPAHLDSNCPIGFGVDGYTISVSGGTLPNSATEQSVPKSELSRNITVNPSSTSVTAKYQVHCGGIKSEFSPTLSIPVHALSQQNP